MDAILYRMSQMEAQGRALEQGLRRRDPAVIEALVEQYQYRLLRYLVHLSGNRALAEDLFQQTWLQVLERGRQYDGHYSFESWLFAIARNLFRDRMRRRRESPWPAFEGDDSALEPATAPSESPFEVYCRQEQQEGVERLLARLAVPYREVLTLRFQEEMQLEEIARVVEIPISTVKSRLYRGLAQLQAWLDEERKRERT